MFHHAFYEVVKGSRSVTKEMKMGDG